MRRSIQLLLLGPVACEPLVELERDDNAATTATTDATASTTWQRPPLATTTGADVTTGGQDSSGRPPTVFIVDVDVIDDSFPCSTFEQDCPRGQKCTVWANDGGPAWNATRCVDIAPDPAGLGEPCTVVDSGVSGVDDCDVGLLCWDVDETNQGECVAFCGGTPELPICPQMQRCTQSASGVVTICIPHCDPLGDDCPATEACYPVDGEFICAPDASGDLGTHGDPCRYINTCDAGHICIGADAHSQCRSNIGCCSAVCNLFDPAADAMCAALDPAQLCQPWFVEGMAPAGYEHVGVCALPL